MTGIGALALVGADVPHILNAIGNFSIIGPVAKMAIAFPLVYHYVGGIRHLYWDKTPEALTNEQVEQSSKVVFGASVAASVLLGFVTI